MNHCVFYWTNLNYDGRVHIIISSLAVSYPDDKIFLYEYPSEKYSYPHLPRNVKIIRPKLLFGRLKKSPYKIFKTIEYAIRSFLFLLFKSPSSIQVHHEIVMYGPLAYKFLFPKKTRLVYDDKELYHIRDKNIGRLEFKTEYCLHEKSDLVIVANEFRNRAMRIMHPHKLLNTLVLDNYVFKGPEELMLSGKFKKEISVLKANNKKILIHQGSVNPIRGEELLVSLAEVLPKDWVLAFIGMNDNKFNQFKAKISTVQADRLYNIGYINYHELNDFYNYVDACVLFYLPTSFNNNFCAPNRLYAAVNSGKPIIVNKNNFVLNHFVTKHNIGESIATASDAENFFTKYDKYADNASKLKNKYELSEFDELKSYYRQSS